MISVCIPTYNGEKFIKEQISSILVQLSPKDEIIISDDDSTDKTLQIISEFKDNRIKIFTHSPEKKPKYKFNLTTRNLENALSKVKGDYIFLADQDDIWEENKVQVIKPFFEKYDLILHDCRIIDGSNNVIKESYFQLNNSKLGIIRNMIKNSYLGCCMAFNRKILESTVPFPKEEVPHDIWIGLIAEWKGEVLLLENQLVKYRRHGDNLSSSSSISKNTLLYKMTYRLLILKELLKVVIK